MHLQPLAHCGSDSHLTEFVRITVQHDFFPQVVQIGFDPDFAQRFKQMPAIALQERAARRKVERIVAKARRSTGGAVREHEEHSEPYREFPRQQMAFEWGDAWEEKNRAVTRRLAEGEDCDKDKDEHHTNAMRFFSAEDHATGRRKFIASTYKEFWRRYSAPELCGKRHHYELIREARPCYLYFDLEYATSANAGVNGTAALALVAYSRSK